MDSGTDAEIIARSIHAPEAFSVIYRRHHDRIFRYVARRVGTDKAADLTAEVFLRAFRVRHRYDPARPSSQPWLYGIATNILGDDLRRLRRQERIYLVIGGSMPQPEDPYQQADDQLVASAVGPELNRVLASLRRGDRDVFLLYAIENLSYRETAEALNIPIGTVRSRLARVRRSIRELIPDLEQRTSRDNGRTP